jgi:hypothetical protein
VSKDLKFHLKHYAKTYAIAVAIALALHFIFRVDPFLPMAIIGLWPLAGSLITIDDDIPGGWTNPDGDQSFPHEVFISAAILAAASLCTGALLNFILTAP